MGGVTLSSTSWIHSIGTENTEVKVQYRRYDVFTNRPKKDDTLNRINDFAFHRKVVFKGNQNFEVHVTLNIKADKEKRSLYNQNKVNYR